MKNWREGRVKVSGGHWSLHVWKDKQSFSRGVRPLTERGHQGILSRSDPQGHCQSLPVAMTTALCSLSKLGWTEASWVDGNSDGARRSMFTLQPRWPDANILSGSRGQGITYLVCSNVPVSRGSAGLRVLEEWPLTSPPRHSVYIHGFIFSLGGVC